MIALFLKRGNVIDNYTEFELNVIYERAYIPGSKIASYYSSEMYQSMVREQMNRSDPPALLEARFLLEARAFRFPNHHFLFEIFDRKLQQYSEADLISYNTKEFKDKSDPNKFKDNEDPFKVLTLEELEAGFVVCLVPLIFSFLVFVLEWMPRMKDFIVFVFIFKKYLEVKEHEQKIFR